MAIGTLRNGRNWTWSPRFPYAARGPFGPSSSVLVVVVRLGLARSVFCWVDDHRPVEPRLGVFPVADDGSRSYLEDGRDLLVAHSTEET